MNPIVSVLVPSRGRVAGLFKILDHCCRAKSEIIIRLDDDDYKSLECVPNFVQRGAGIVIGKRVGYHGLHKMFDECAAVSSGNWLMGFNDDAWMEKAGWEDSLVGLNHNKPMLLFPKVEYPIDHESEEWKNFAKRDRLDFPIISRAAYLKIGTVSPSPVCDWFWYEALQAVPALVGKVGYFNVYHTYSRERGFDVDTQGDEGVKIHNSKPIQKEIKRCLTLLKK
jgi:hypothetical protein